MAQVDFTNAVFESYNPNDWCPAGESWLGIQPRNNYSDMHNRIVDVSGTDLTSGNNRVTALLETPKKFVLNISGSFSASGTEFYIQWPDNHALHWKISNVTFQSGDTFDFTISATLNN